ncbi:MAG: hypothetical protein LBG19_01105 [Prevotellaceae bacterium]|jgi:Tol biopolymer transport system component|nr:hypothetical protein [Prevotellaceae bacterium]
MMLLYSRFIEDPQQGDILGLYISNMDGTNEKLIFKDTYEFNLGSKIGGFEWRPDGKRVPVFYDHWNPNNEPPTRKIFSINIENATIEELQQNKGISISPDGDYIAYSDVANKNLYICDINGNNIKQLTNFTDDTYVEICPSWSKDGKIIAYVTYKLTDEGNDVERCEVCTINVDGSNQKTLVATDSGDEFGMPKISPDGKNML